MYIRKISRKNADGSVVSYLQLAHNVRDPQKGYTKAEVIYNFGRQEELDVATIKRLVKSLCRFLSPEDALEATAALAGSGGDGSLRFITSRAMGGAYLLRKLWERIGIEGVLSRTIANREFTSPVEWAVFAMVANRALAPDSKRGVVEWVDKNVALGNEAPIALQHLYRAMDVLLENDESIQKEVFFSTATLLNLEVDLLFFDTTSTYFERDEEDEEEGALLRYGKSKDKRDDLPQIVIGLAVTKEGIPVRCWVLPGNTADASTVEMVQKDLAGWKMSRCVWVMDRGMAGEENRRILQRAGGHYILGEKLRDRQEANQAALSTPGRYRKIRENMEVKEIVVGDGERRRRFVLVFNPEEAKK
ncbi:MAG TPA: IS1634 family transposase, partial [Candidatus Deferrimicrobium sp.]